MNVEDAAKASRFWMVGLGTEVLRIADSHSNVAAKLLDKVNVIAACASLQDEAVIRVRCQPRIFEFKA